MKAWLRASLVAGFLVMLVQPAAGEEATATLIHKRARVIIDNDFGGDPDGLFQLAHHLLSPSVEVRGIIGSHHHARGFYGYPGSSKHGVKMAEELLGLMGLTGKAPVIRGAETSLGEAAVEGDDEAARFIVRECLREDAREPLYVVCGAGLTNVAMACRMDPSIAGRMTVVWIGGSGAEGLEPPPPTPKRAEYNLGIDARAAEVVFRETRVPLWQVPRDAYRQALVSQAELEARLGGGGKLGGHLLARLHDLMKRANGSLGEAYVLGDNPLVLLTALQSSWEPDPSSCESAAPGDGKPGKESDPAGRIRVFRKLDTRLMFEDFFAKVAAFDRSLPPP